MTDFIIVGNGGHVSKKIIPSINEMGGSILGIFTNSSQGSDALGNQLVPQNFWLDYSAGLSKPLDEVAILIASPPSAHLENITKLGSLGFHSFIVEKPAVTTKSELEILRAGIGHKTQLINMYEFSLFWKKFLFTVKEMQRGALQQLVDINFQFTVPEEAIDDKNFRKASIKDGGALCDIGYYPLSAAYLVLAEFGVGPQIEKLSLYRNAFGVPQYGSFSLVQRENIAVSGDWGLSDIYSNKVSLQIGAIRKEFSFIFSKPELASPNITSWNGDIVTHEIFCEDRDQYTMNLESALTQSGRDINDDMLDFVMSAFDKYSVIRGET